MSLQLMIGNSGSGKSYQLYRNIIEASFQNPEHNYMIIVPEQFTMQTQKDLVSMHPNKGIMNIDVLSFQRLAHRVFEEVGGDYRKILEETGKSLILRKIAGDKQAELKLLGRNLKKIGYISELKSIISELTQYSIGTEELDKISRLTEKRPGLNLKMHDIRLIYEAFHKYLEDKYITEEETLEVLAAVAGRSEWLREAVIAIDGFTGFTPIQNRLLEQLMIYARQIYITVTADVREDPFTVDEDYRLFHMSKKTIDGLYETAKKARIKVDQPVMIRNQPVYRFRNNETLGFLEAHLFRFGNEAYLEERDNIQLWRMKNPDEECKFIARKIRELVRTKGYHYKDIAVITGEMDSYGSYMEMAFEQLKIPCFIDHKRSVLLNPFIEFIRALLDMVERNFDYEGIFRFFRCGLLDYDMETIDEVENYVLALGIKGHKKWKEKWIRVYKGLEDEKLASYNQFRMTFIEAIEPLRKVLKSRKSKVYDFTSQLYIFISDHNIQVKLKAYEEKFIAGGQLALAKEYSQIYKIVIELFDKLVGLIGEEKISLKEYKEILDSGFEEAKVGVIPPSMDQVMVGDIERSRLKDIKVLFFAGVNDGIIPKSNPGGGVISELDREFLAENQIKLAPTMRENSYIQKFYLYLNLTKPTEYLYLSYSKVNAGGDTIRPSYLVYTIQKLFPAIKVKEDNPEADMVSQIETPENGIPYLIQGMENARNGQMTAEWMELFQWYFKDENWNDRVMQLVEAAFTVYTDTALGRAAAKALYGNVLENSVTRLEKYAECGFAHFLQYGLFLWEREEYGFAALDMGNVFHRTLELFSEKLENSQYNWFDLPEEVSEQLLEESVEESIIDYGNTVLYSNARNQYMIRRMKRMAGRTVWALSQQLKKGRFTPTRYEVAFSMEEDLESVNILLSQEEQMRLKGRIDRMDTYEQDGQVYVKVIDYKSGNTDFDIVALYHGLQLQLVVYLNAAMELEKKASPDKEVIPAGIFYYNMKDPMIDREKKIDEEAVQQELLKELKMKGLVNEDPEIISYLDETIDKSSAVIPVTLNAGGKVSKKSSTASSRQFQMLSHYVNHKMKELGSEILEGKIAANPYEWNQKTACDYCGFGGICGFDDKIPGYQYKRLKGLAKDKVWGMLENKDEEEA